MKVSDRSVWSFEEITKSGSVFSKNGRLPSFYRVSVRFFIVRIFVGSAFHKLSVRSFQKLDPIGFSAQLNEPISSLGITSTEQRDSGIAVQFSGIIKIKLSIILDNKITPPYKQ